MCETLRSGMLQAQSPDWLVGLAASTARMYGATVHCRDCRPAEQVVDAASVDAPNVPLRAEHACIGPSGRAGCP
jgi:hypothetical protein